MLLKMLDTQHQSRQGQAEAGATSAAPGGPLRSADTLGSPEAGVAQSSGCVGFSSMGMLEGASIPTPALAG